MALAREARAAFEAYARMDGLTPDSGLPIPHSRQYEIACSPVPEGATEYEPAQFRPFPLRGAKFRAC